MSDDVLDFFGTPDLVAAARQAGDAIPSIVALAWYLRQRDTHAALCHADAAALRIDALPASGRDEARGRLALVRAEAAWLLNRMTEAEQQLDAARAAFDAAGNAVGLGDADLLHASLLDQTGGDRDSALHAAHRRFRDAGARMRERIAATWLACSEATARPDDAVANWGAALDEAAALEEAGLTTYVEGARGTLAWRRGNPAAAIRNYQRAFDAALLSGQLQSAVTLAQNIGIAFSLLYDHEGALAWAARARELVEPTGWPYATGWCLMQTGSILVGLGRAQAAKELLLEGMPMLRGAEGSRNHALACQTLAEACLELRQDAEALHWCETGLGSAAKLAFPDLVSGILRYRARALSRLNRVVEATHAAEQGLAVAVAASDWSRVASIHHVLAEIARQHHLPAPPGATAASGAIHHLEAALASGARMPEFAAPPEWHAELSAARQAAGDLRGALQSERLASQARQQQNSRRADELATAMLVRHQTERALAEAQHQRALAEASELRAALLETKAALERERMQSLLAHAAKMVAIGRLASGVVHEMSHPVGTLMLLAEALADRLADGPSEISSPMQTLVGEARRLQQFIARLRDFARVEPPRIGRHDLRAVLADARQLFAIRLALERVRYSEEVPALMVEVDPQRLALAIANIVFNAADALAGCTDPLIHLAAATIDSRVVLYVDDNGPGLRDEVRARLFEPFFTTKPEGKGLGLGLALSAEALAAMGGRIAAENRPSGGARFSILFG